MDPTQFMPKRTLKNLAQEKRVKLPLGFSSSFSGMETFDGHPKILREFKRNKLGIKIICSWPGGGGSAHIRSGEKDLLDEIETMLPFWIGKTLVEIYGKEF